MNIGVPIAVLPDDSIDFARRNGNVNWRGLERWALIKGEVMRPYLSCVKPSIECNVIWDPCMHVETASESEP